MSFVEQLREELVTAAEREEERTGPRLSLPPLRPVALAAAGIALAAILVIVVAGGLRSDRAPVEHTAKPPPPEGRPMFDGTLTPGVRYRTRAFVPALSFVVGDDRWYVTETDTTDSLVLRRVTRGGPQPPGPPDTLMFAPARDVYDPRVRDLHDARMPAPADLESWLAGHPDIRPSRGHSVTIGGASGETLEAVVRFKRPAHEDPFCRETFRQACTLIAPGFSLFDGMHLRFIQLRTNPEWLTISTVATSKRRLDALNRVAAPILDSLRVGIR